MNLAVAVALGLVIGLTLGALGGGGSILAVPVLVYLAGQSVTAATSTSLVAVGTSAAVGAVSHARRGNVRWGAAAAFIATGVPGAWLGSTLNHRMNGDVLLLLFSGLVLVAAHRMLTACPSCTKVGEEEALSDPHGDTPATGGPARSGVAVARARPNVRTVRVGAVARFLVAGTIVGFLTGLFGVGGGFVIVPALTLALGLNMPQAIGTSLVVIVGNALVALGFRGVDAVDWHVAVPFTATMIAGSVIGSMIGHRLPAKQSLQAFAGLLVAVAIANGIAATVALVG